MKIKKGNQVEITAGKDSGKRGEVLYVFPRLENVMLVCPHTNALTRIGYRFEGGEKVRVSKKSGKVI